MRMRVGIHIDKQQGETLKIWADNYWMMSHSKNALGADGEAADRGGRWGLELTPAGLCVGPALLQQRTRRTR